MTESVLITEPVESFNCNVPVEAPAFDLAVTLTYVFPSTVANAAVNPAFALGFSVTPVDEAICHKYVSPQLRVTASEPEDT